MKQKLPEQLECNRCFKEERKDSKGNTPLMILVEGTSSYDPTQEAEWLECKICGLYLEAGDFDNSDEEYEKTIEEN